MAERKPPKHKTHRSLPRPPFENIALLLQGGGALGSYQAGVYQALAEADLHPDWVAGISIGAINCALIAGNPPERAGRAAARSSGRRSPQPPLGLPDLVVGRDQGRHARTAGQPDRAPSASCCGGAPQFFAPRMPPPFLHAARQRRGAELLRHRAA